MERMVSANNFKQKKESYLEASQVWYVKEWNLVDVQHEATFPGVSSKWSFTQSFCLLDSQFSLVTLLLEMLALAERHGVRVFILPVFRQFKGV